MAQKGLCLVLGGSVFGVRAVGELSWQRKKRKNNNTASTVGEKKLEAGTVAAEIPPPLPAN